MVLQQGQKVPVWGWASPGESVRVSLEQNQASATTNADGVWQLQLDPLKSGGPYTLTVAGSKDKITIKDVLVGEVWLCSGQSWMTWAVGGSVNATEEIKNANHPEIRMFTVKETAALTPQDDCPGSWQVCTPSTVSTFSGCGYFFARRLQKSLGVPVGMIHSSVPGTTAWSWSGRDVFETEPGLKARQKAFDLAAGQFGKIFYDKYGSLVRQWLEQRASAESVPSPAGLNMFRASPEQWQAWLEGAEKASAAGTSVALPPEVQPFPTEDPRNSSRGPASVLFNGMINPLIPYGIAGIIWYQGGTENNYRSLFQAMIRSWRQKWGQGDIPFLFVQRANLGEKLAPATLPEFRQDQAAALSLPRTGMAVAIDIGLPDNIHPTNTQDVGLRLALVAEKMVYGRDVVASGPTCIRVDAEGGSLRLHFTNLGGGLVARGGGELKGFELAGADEKYVPARAVLIGDSITLQSDSVTAPVAVRYAWSVNPDCNLFNQAGLPAAPFQSAITTSAASK
ncbi:sialate O-acetylesterase [soil metagenome]